MYKRKGGSKLLIASLVLASLAINGGVSTSETVFASSGNIKIHQRVGITPPKDTVQPTVFMHGYKGGGETFRATFSNYGHKKGEFGLENVKSTYYKTVNGEKLYKSGQDGIIFIDYKGEGKLYDLPAYGKLDNVFEIVFQDDTASLITQQKYFKTALAELEKYYKTKGKSIYRLNLVGHSMGGLTVAKYALDNRNRIVNKKYDIPYIKSLTTFNSPFGGADSVLLFPCKLACGSNPAAKDLTRVTNSIIEWFYNDTMVITHRIHKNTTVTVGRNPNNNNNASLLDLDWAVKPASAQMAKDLIAPVGAHFEFTDIYLGHSDSLGSQQMIDAIYLEHNDLTSVYK